MIDTEQRAVSIEELPIFARLTFWLGRVWHLQRGRGRLLRCFRNQLGGAQSHLVTRLKNSRLRVKLPVADETGLVLTLFGEHDANVGPHERWVTETTLRILRDSGGTDVVLDIGANLGSFAWRILEETNARVIAYEPQPRLVELLLENAAANRLSDRLEVRAAALSDVDGQAGLNVDADVTGTGQLAGASNAGMTVSVRRLSDEFSPEQWRRVRMAKIDVEGYELEVLRGAGDLWKQHRPVVVFEVMLPLLAERDQQPAEVFSFLREQGYTGFFAIDRFLYPPANGLHRLGNVLAVAPEHSNLLGKLPIDQNFRPKGTPVNPVERVVL